MSRQIIIVGLLMAGCVFTPEPEKGGGQPGPDGGVAADAHVPTQDAAAGADGGVDQDAAGPTPDAALDAALDASTCPDASCGDGGCADASACGDLGPVDAAVDANLDARSRDAAAHDGAR